MDVQQRIADILSANGHQADAQIIKALVSGLGLRRETATVLQGRDGNYRQVWPPSHAAVARVLEGQDGFRYVTDWASSDGA